MQNGNDMNTWKEALIFRRKVPTENVTAVIESFHHVLYSNLPLARWLWQGHKRMDRMTKKDTCSCMVQVCSSYWWTVDGGHHNQHTECHISGYGCKRRANGCADDNSIP